MEPLAKPLRRQLEDVVVKACDEGAADGWELVNRGGAVKLTFFSPHASGAPT